MVQTSDHNVTETAFDAVKCKLSASTLGYFHDPFLSYFVTKPTRRIPLIHRGYYLRHISISNCMNRFLNAHVNQPVQILSLGAGFDTLYFQLMQQQYETQQSIHFVEVDCKEISEAKNEIIQRSETFGKLFPDNSEMITDHTLATSILAQIKSRHSIYTLCSCDLGDLSRLQSTVVSAGLLPNLPTLILAECVVSYLEATRGSSLLQWLSKHFIDASMVIYDPFQLSDMFGATLQNYFAVKGCELRALRSFQTAKDHFHRFLGSTQAWTACRIIDMNHVYESCANEEEKQRIQRLEAFDEFADWIICNAHYAIYLVTNVPRSPSSPQSFHWTQEFSSARGMMAQRFSMCGLSEMQTAKSVPVILRTFQVDDLNEVQKLFQSTHLEYQCKAVTRFVNHRLRKGGDMADITSSFLTDPKSHFWVVDAMGLDDENCGSIIGCIGLKRRSDTTAELCRLSVDPKWRRRGVATKLVQAFEEFAMIQRYQHIVADTIETMEDAQRFYTSLKYTEANNRQKFSTFTLVSFNKSIPSP